MTPSCETTSRILTAIGLYYLVCVVSAIMAPVLWIRVSGISLELSPQNTLLLGVIGAYMSTASYVAFIAARSFAHRNVIVKSLLLANFLDAFVTGRAIADGALPLQPGLLFMITIMLCIVALYYTLLKSRNIQD